MTQLKERAYSSPENIRKRHSERQRKRIRRMKIRRTVFFSVLFLIAVFIILFYTPIFNIRSIEIQGNQKVEESVILSSIGDVEGNNIFRTKVSSIKKNILTIPYIDTVEIDRVILSSKLAVTVTECEEAAFITTSSGYVIIDSSAKVLAQAAENEMPVGIPEVTGLSVTNVTVGEKLNIEESDKFDILVECLDIMKKIDILSGVRSISVADVSNITFNYEDRLDAICGTSVDLEKKLSFFKSAVNSSRLTENSRGTIDLTTAGRVIYSP